MATAKTPKTTKTTTEQNKTDTVQTDTTQTDIVQTDTVQTEQTDTEQTEQTEQTQDTTIQQPVNPHLLKYGITDTTLVPFDAEEETVKDILKSLDILTIGALGTPNKELLSLLGYNNLTLFNAAWAKTSIIEEFRPKDPNIIKDQWVLVDSVKLSKENSICLIVFSWQPDVIYTAKTTPLGLGMTQTYSQFLEYVDQFLTMSIRLSVSKEDGTLNTIPLVEDLDPSLGNLKNKVIADTTLHSRLVINPNCFTQSVFDALNTSYADLKGFTGKKRDDYVASQGILGTARKSLLLPGVKVESNFKKSMKQLMSDF